MNRPHFWTLSFIALVLAGGVGFAVFSERRHHLSPEARSSGESESNSGSGQLAPRALYRIEVSTEVYGQAAPVQAALETLLWMTTAGATCEGCRVAWAQDPRVHVSVGGDAMQGALLDAAKAQARRPFLLLPPSQNALLASPESRWRLRVHRSLVSDGEGSGVLGLLRQTASFWASPFVEVQKQMQSPAPGVAREMLEQERVFLRDEGTSGIRTFKRAENLSEGNKGIEPPCLATTDHEHAREELHKRSGIPATASLWQRSTREAQLDESRYFILSLAPVAFPFGILKIEGTEKVHFSFGDSLSVEGKGRICISLEQTQASGEPPAAQQREIVFTDEYVEVPLFAPRAERSKVALPLTPDELNEVRREVTPRSLRNAWTESSLANDEQMANFTGRLVRRLRADPSFAFELEAWMRELEPTGRRYLAALRALVSAGDSFAQAALRNLSDALGGDVEKQVWMSLSSMDTIDVESGRWMLASLEGPPKENEMAQFMPLAAGSAAQRVASLDTDLALALTRRARAEFLAAESTVQQRIVALRVLGNAGLDVDATLLLKVLQGTRDPVFREALFDSLRMFKDPDTFSALREGALDVNAQTAHMALATLSLRIGARTSRDDIAFVPLLLARVDAVFENLTKSGSEVPFESVRLVSRLREMGHLNAEDVLRLAAALNSPSYRALLETSVRR